MKLEFKFNIDDKVKTSLESTGIIGGLYYDEAGLQYNIKTKDGSQWWKEKELTLINKATSG
jgi:hypothetical protein